MRITKTQALVAQIIKANAEANALRLALANAKLASLKEVMQLRKDKYDLEATLLQGQVTQTSKEIQALTVKHELPEKPFTFAEDDEGWYLELIPDEH